MKFSVLLLKELLKVAAATRNKSKVKPDKSQKGPELEDKIFEEIKAFFRKNDVKNTVVFSGLKIPEVKESADKLSTPEGEFDFYIISESLRAVIHIEVKRSNNPKARDSANSQHKKGREFFETKIPFKEDENWKYMKYIFFGNSGGQCCSKCKKWVRDVRKTAIEDWWNELSVILNRGITFL